jgi:hypothetical protein
VHDEGGGGGGGAAAFATAKILRLISKRWKKKMAFSIANETVTILAGVKQTQSEFSQLPFYLHE